MPKKNMETSILELAHIAFERNSKTNTEQQKPNKPTSIQADQNIAKPPSQQLGSTRCQRGRRQGRSLQIRRTSAEVAGRAGYQLLRQKSFTKLGGEASPPSAGPNHCRQPSRFPGKNAPKNDLQIQTTFFHVFNRFCMSLGSQEKSLLVDFLKNM